MNYTINTLDQLKPILIGFRKSRGFSQKAVAEKLGISQQSYQVLESAPQKVTLKRLYKVLSVLEVKLNFIDHIKYKQDFDQDYSVKRQNQKYQDDW